MTIHDRVMSKVATGPGCWTWTGATDRHGYGVAWDGRRTARAHRLVWELLIGAIPEGMELCHHCDNPPCVRPSHLFVGTHVANFRDAQRKGRLHTGDQPRTHCRYGHPFDATNTYRDPKHGHRHCLTCRAEVRARSNARRSGAAA